MSAERKRPEIVGIHPAGPDHRVVTVEGGEHAYCRRPCQECPWRLDALPGEFPPEAYRHSAQTAYDLSRHTFACHMSGTERPRVCAGFLLRGAAHNMAARMRRIRGEWMDVEDGGVELYEDYRAMAEANGVDPDDPVLARCR